MPLHNAYSQRFTVSLCRVHIVTQQTGHFSLSTLKEWKAEPTSNWLFDSVGIEHRSWVELWLQHRRLSTAPQGSEERQIPFNIWADSNTVTFDLISSHIFLLFLFFFYSANSIQKCTIWKVFGKRQKSFLLAEISVCLAEGCASWTAVLAKICHQESGENGVGNQRSEGGAELC